MTQRAFAHIAIWLMIVAGILLSLVVFVVPYITAIIAQMEMHLPAVVQLVLNLSHLAVQYSWFFLSFYAALFIAVIIWYRRSGPHTKIP